MSITTPICRGKTAVCRWSDFGGHHRYNVTGLFHDMWGFPSNNPSVVQDLLRHLVDKIDTNVDVITRYKEHCLDDAEYILVSYGSSARSAIHLAKNRRQKGERLGVLELQSIWPFPAEMVRAKCANAKAVIVVEMNMGQVLTQVKARSTSRTGCSSPTASTANLSHHPTSRDFSGSSREKGYDNGYQGLFTGKILPPHVVSGLRPWDSIELAAQGG